MNTIAKVEPPGLRVAIGGSVSTGHELRLEVDDTLSRIFRTNDPAQADALLGQCFRVLSASEAGDAGARNDERSFMLSVVNDLAPRDAVERMLAVQMATTHVATIRAARRMANAQEFHQIEAYTNAYAKLTRSFAAQVEALRRHRTGGKQTVVVQHVTVADGGQAIVGHVQTGGVRIDER